MGFTEELTKLCEEINERKPLCQGNEEATKQALILPFLNMLGYNVWNPSEVIPEYKAGFSANKEKVDYALFINSKPACFIEAKAVGGNLANYDAQLAKYFNSTPEIKVGIITDGITYKFFSDSKQPNIMDAEPFYELNMLELDEQDIIILQSLRKDNFNVDTILAQAEDLYYLNGINQKLRSNFSHPSDDFVRLLAQDVYPKKLTEKAVERLRPLVKEALSQTLLDMVSKGLSQGISNHIESSQSLSEVLEEDKSSRSVETTQAELDAYHAILAIIEKDYGAGHGVNHKDTMNYFGIQVEKVTRWFCRLHFNNQRRKFILFRLPENKAKEAAGSLDIQPHSEGWTVTYEKLEDIQKMHQLIVAAYQSQIIPTVET
jgi:hypothetical protein